MSTEYVHAALLLHFAKQPINEENLKKVIQAAGIDADESKIKALTTAISEVNIEEAIKAAPIGFAPPTAATTQAVAEAEKPKAEAKKEKEEKKEEEALEGLGSLFG